MGGNRHAHCSTRGIDSSKRSDDARAAQLKQSALPPSESEPQYHAAGRSRERVLTRAAAVRKGRDGSSLPMRIELMHSRRRFRFLGIVIIAFAAAMRAPQTPAQ